METVSIGVAVPSPRRIATVAVPGGAPDRESSFVVHPLAAPLLLPVAVREFGLLLVHPLEVALEPSVLRAVVAPLLLLPPLTVVRLLLELVVQQRRTVTPPPVLVEALWVPARERPDLAEAVDVMGALAYFVHRLGELLPAFRAFVIRLFRVAVLPSVLPAAVRVR